MFPKTGIRFTAYTQIGDETSLYPVVINREVEPDSA